MEANRITGPLSEEQWAGLARLGDLGNRLAGAIDGSLGGPATTAVDRLGALDSRYDLGTLVEKVVGVLSALDRAGLLDHLRDNAQFAADSLDVLAPVLSQWLQRLDQLPADELKADAEFALSLLRKARVIGQVIDDKLAGELTGKAVGITEFMQRNQTDEALAEMLVQLGRMYRSGLLSRLGDLADYVAGLKEGADVESLFGDLVKTMPTDAIGQTMHLLHSAEDAMRDARKDEKHLGGYSGMLHLFRDKNVQKGLRMLSVLPIYLEKRLEPEKVSGSV